MGHLLALAAGMFLILCTLPGTVELLLLTLGALLAKPATKNPAKPLKTAVVVPAHNEEVNLLKTLESLKLVRASLRSSLLPTIAPIKRPPSLNKRWLVFSSAMNPRA